MVKPRVNDNRHIEPQRMDPLGKSPIALPLLVLGKLALAGNLTFLFLKGSVSTVYSSGVVDLAGLMLVIGGSVIVILGFVFLGKSLSVGLPEGNTELKTRCIYRFTRNPLYVGGLFVGLGFCLYVGHAVNILLLCVAAWIHHRIILREEEFLECRFGRQWTDYTARVPRYLGPW